MPNWLFAASPVLVFAFAFALPELRRGRRLEIAVGLSIFLSYLAMNASFNAWHGGFAFGPRYLVPAIPFVAFGLVPAFHRWPRVTAAAAAASIAVCLAATAIDPMPPAAMVANAVSLAANDAASGDMVVAKLAARNTPIHAHMA